MATVLNVYDDQSLPMVVQPVKYAVPWPVLPKAEDYPSTTANAAIIPTVDWVWQFWEEDLRIALTNWLAQDMQMAIGNSIRNLPDNYITTIYRNIFQNVFEHFDDAPMCRVDNQLISGVPHATGAYWLGYWLALYMYAQLAAQDQTPETLYRMKQVLDMSGVMAYALTQSLATNPTNEKGPYLILCATKSADTRNVMLVDHDLMSAWLDAGGNVNQLCVDYINSGSNPKLGVDF